jgi:hypothetical protein
MSHTLTKVLLGISCFTPLVYESFFIYLAVKMSQNANGPLTGIIVQCVVASIGLLAHWFFAALGIAGGRSVTTLNVVQLFLGIISAAYLGAAAYLSYAIYVFVNSSVGAVCSLFRFLYWCIRVTFCAFDSCDVYFLIYSTFCLFIP